MCRLQYACTLCVLGEVLCFQVNILCANIFSFLNISWLADQLMYLFAYMQFNWTHFPLFIYVSSRDLQTKSSVSTDLSMPDQ